MWKRHVQQLLTRALGQGVRFKSDLVALETHGRVAVLKLNEPDKLNLMTRPMGEAIKARVEEINARANEFSAVVLTGEGRAFSAGGDLQFLLDRAKDTPSRNGVLMRDFYSLYLNLRKLELPLVGAINGPAIGAGMGIALFCDVRVATTEAKMGFTFVNLGLHPGMGTTHFLPQIVAPSIAAQLLLTGKVINGEEAARLGLVNKCVPRDQVLPSAIELAEEMAKPSAVAVRTLVRSLRMKQDAGLEASLQREADAQAHSYASKDYLEGVQALIEKRAPNFKVLESFKL